MVPPIWPDEQGRRSGSRASAWHLKHVGWRLFNAETYVNWCGHGQEVIPVPREDGPVEFVPVLGEAT